MNDANRLKAHAEELQRSIEAPHLHARNSAKFVIGLKDVTKNAFECVRSFLLRVKRNLAFGLEAYRADIVQSQDVVSVSVSVKNGVQPGDLFANSLLAKVRRGVDEYRTAVKLDKNRRPRAVVVRISRRAHAAIAPDGGNAHRRSAAQHGEDCFHFFSA